MPHRYPPIVHAAANNFHQQHQALQHENERLQQHVRTLSPPSPASTVTLPLPGHVSLDMYLSVNTTSLSIVLKSVIRLQGNESSDTQIGVEEASDDYQFSLHSKHVLGLVPKYRFSSSLPVRVRADETRFPHSVFGFRFDRQTRFCDNADALSQKDLNTAG